jgi:hypothetical protein
MEIKKIERDENGLVKGVDYVFDEHGMIDWRKTLPKKFFYFKDDQYQGEDIDNVPDNALLVYLDGFKWLAKIRGYKSIRYPVVQSNTDFATCVCEIDWIGNYETEGRDVVHSSVGYSTLDNTSDFMGLYLGPDAENKAFIRAVRTFLRVNVCGGEEIAPENNFKRVKIRKEAKNEYGSSDVVNILEDCMNKLNLDFATVLKTVKDDGEKFDEDPKNLKELHSKKPTLTMKLIGRMKKKLKNKK